MHSSYTGARLRAFQLCWCLPACQLCWCPASCCAGAYLGLTGVSTFPPAYYPCQGGRCPPGPASDVPCISLFLSLTCHQGRYLPLASLVRSVGALALLRMQPDLVRQVRMS